MLATDDLPPSVNDGACTSVTLSLKVPWRDVVAYLYNQETGWLYRLWIGLLVQVDDVEFAFIFQPRWKFQE